MSGLIDGNLDIPGTGATVSQIKSSHSVSAVLFLSRNTSGRVAGGAIPLSVFRPLKAEWTYP